MIVSDNLKLIFIHVPKTGGNSVREALRDATDDVRIAGPWHLTAMTGKAMITDWHKYTSIAFVRNPWERMVSGYAFAVGNAAISFEEFLRSLMWPDLMRSQMEWLVDVDGTQLIDVIGRYESIDADFRGVCRQPLKRLNATVHAQYQEYYTNKTRSLVADIFANDISKFGYRF